MSYKYILLIICFSAFLYISGCVIVPGGGYAAGELEVDMAPPPPPPVVVERPPRPGSLYIWIDGHYIVSSGRWVWVRGRWELPPRRGNIWVEPHVRQRGPRWGYTPGHWR
jgi:hypothetical protein